MEKAEFTSESTTCTRCSKELDNAIAAYRAAILYTMQYAYDIRIVDKICRHCHKVHFVDGLFDHMLNFNNKQFVCHGFLNGWTDYRITAKRPTLEAFMRQRRAAYVCNKSDYAVLSKPQFEKIYHSFLYLQQWQCKNVCPSCDTVLKNDINGTAQVK